MKEIIPYLLSFQPYVLLPIIILLLGLAFRITFEVVLKSAMQIGIAFIGIFMIIDYFVSIIDPAIKQLIAKTGLDVGVLDTGWPPLANITWSYEYAPLLLVLFMGINALLLVFRLTRVINIDLWNYWHSIFLATIIHFVTGNIWYAFLASIVSFVLALKIAEWSARRTNDLVQMEGVCVPHLSANIHYPVALFLNHLLDYIPGINRFELNPKTLKKRLGVFGEPMMIGLIIGLLLGFGAGYDAKDSLHLAFKFAAVVYILPVMGGILGGALLPISDGMKDLINKKFPDLGPTYIGLDVAILFSSPAVIVTALLLIPTSIVLSLLLPNINFIPLGDLTNLLVPASFIVLATNGNLLRAYLIGIPIVIGTLYYASHYAETITAMASSSNYQIEGYDGIFTSFLDGGNLFRGFMVQLFDGQWIGFVLLPVVFGLIIYTYKFKD